MDGAKLVTDTIDILKDYGRQAFYLGRTFFVRKKGPSRNENPGSSKEQNKVRIFGTERARVSQQCKSAESKSILTIT